MIVTTYVFPGMSGAKRLRNLAESERNPYRKSRRPAATFLAAVKARSSARFHQLKEKLWR
jgi:hypothetical protein